MLLTLHRQFRFVFHRLEVRDGDGRALGAIEKEWSWIRRIYRIEGGPRMLQLFGPFLEPWTFEIRAGDQMLGTIRKRWSGLTKEMFTDADNFGIDLSGIADPALKLLAFAAVVLIDIVHFERAK